MGVLKEEAKGERINGRRGDGGRERETDAEAKKDKYREWECRVGVRET